MAEVITGGDLTLSARNLRDEADLLEREGDADGAKCHREAAHRLDEAAAWLRGERQAAGPQDIEPTPPMTLERACEVFSEFEYAGATNWRVGDYETEGWPIKPGERYAYRGDTIWYPEWLAIAAAEKLLRDGPPKEVADA